MKSNKVLSVVEMTDTRTGLKQDGGRNEKNPFQKAAAKILQINLAIWKCPRKIPRFTPKGAIVLFENTFLITCM